MNNVKFTEIVTTDLKFRTLLLLSSACSQITKRQWLCSRSHIYSAQMLGISRTHLQSQYRSRHKLLLFLSVRIDQDSSSSVSIYLSILSSPARLAFRALQNIPVISTRVTCQIPRTISSPSRATHRDLNLNEISIASRCRLPQIDPLPLLPRSRGNV